MLGQLRNIRMGFDNFLVNVICGLSNYLNATNDITLLVFIYEEILFADAVNQAANPSNRLYDVIQSLGVLDCIDLSHKANKSFLTA